MDLLENPANILKEALGLNARYAVLDDAHDLAVLHMRAANQQVRAFLPSLGVRFLVRYYKILLQESGTVILCATRPDGRLVGFVSGTLHAEEHFANLRTKKLQILLSMSPLTWFHPRVIFGLLVRSRRMRGNINPVKYVVQSGCRIEYWAWDPQDTIGRGSLLLLGAYLQTVRSRGIKSVLLEIDAFDRRSKTSHLFLGAKEVDRFRTPDGKDRLVMAYNL